MNFIGVANAVPCDPRCKRGSVGKAYIEARYKKSYKITEDELSELIDKVTIFQQTAQHLCEEQIASYKGMG